MQTNSKPVSMSTGKRTTGPGHRAALGNPLNQAQLVDSPTTMIYENPLPYLIDTDATDSYINCDVAQTCKFNKARQTNTHTITQLTDGSERILKTDNELQFIHEGSLHTFNAKHTPPMAEEFIQGMDSLPQMGLNLHLDPIQPEHHQKSTENDLSRNLIFHKIPSKFSVELTPADAAHHRKTIEAPPRPCAKATPPPQVIENTPLTSTVTPLALLASKFATPPPPPEPPPQSNTARFSRFQLKLCF